MYLITEIRKRQRNMCGSAWALFSLEFWPLIHRTHWFFPPPASKHQARLRLALGGASWARQCPEVPSLPGWTSSAQDGRKHVAYVGLGPDSTFQSCFVRNKFHILHFDPNLTSMSFSQLVQQLNNTFIRITGHFKTPRMRIYLGTNLESPYL